MDEAQMTDHDALIRLEGQFGALNQTIAANNIAAVERDTRIEGELKRVNGSIAKHEERLTILWNDRSIWNWVIRAFVIGTPIAVVVANYLSRS